MTKKDIPLLGQIIMKVAPLIGATVVLEPSWGIAGQITFKNGRHSYFKYNTLNVNQVGSAELVKDKDYANFFIQRLGYPVVPKSKTFYSKEWGATIGVSNQGVEAACQYAASIGFPVVVKPNSGSQGTSVFFVHSAAALKKALKHIFVFDRVALVQQVVTGKDYRLVVFEDTVIAVYERIPLHVIGDGVSTIAALLERKLAAFTATSRDVGIKRNDPRMLLKLKQERRSLKTVPAAGERVFLLDNANLSSGGEMVDVTAVTHPEFKKIAINLTRDMGLRLSGVDVIVVGDITEPPEQYFVLEINASPGLNHYASAGKAQRRVAEDLYLTILKRIEQES